MVGHRDDCRRVARVFKLPKYDFSSSVRGRYLGG